MATDNADEMREEYDFSGGVRGAFHVRFRKGTRVSMLEPDVAKVFPDSISMNKALAS